MSPTAGESRQRKCSKCQRELVNAHGVHMGIPFGHWNYRLGTDDLSRGRMLICGKCYDEVTADDHKVANRINLFQKTGDEPV